MGSRRNMVAVLKLRALLCSLLVVSGLLEGACGGRSAGNANGGAGPGTGGTGSDAGGAGRQSAGGKGAEGAGGNGGAGIASGGCSDCVQVECEPGYHAESAGGCCPACVP